MYAQTCTRPDISFAVGMLGRYQSNPGLDHWKAAKKVLRYLQGTKDHMLTYKRSDHLEVIGYTDSDFAGCVDTRLVAKGFTQKDDIDYKETFSPVSKKDSFRIIMALVAHYDLELHHMDVKTSFLNGNLEEDVYMDQPDENQIKEVFINGGRGHPPSHLKFFLLVFSKLKEDIK